MDVGTSQDDPFTASNEAGPSNWYTDQDERWQGNWSPPVTDVRSQYPTGPPAQTPYQPPIQYEEDWE